MEEPGLTPPRAAAAGRYGTGWAIGISPHPEQTDGLRDMLPAALQWAKTMPAGK